MLMHPFQYLISGILSLLVGYYIASRRPETVALKSLLLMSVITGFWEFCVFLSKTAPDAIVAARYWMIIIGTSHLVLPLYLFTLLNIAEKRDWRNALVFIPFLIQVTIMAQEPYLTNFEFLLTEFGWTYHVIQYETPLVVVGLIFVGYLMGIIAVFVTLIRKTKLPVLRRKYTLLFLSFLLFQAVGTTVINALISVNVLTPNTSIGGISQFLAFLSIGYALTLKEPALPVAPTQEKDFAQIYSSFLTILHNAALEGQLGKEAGKFTDFISQSQLAEHVSIANKRIVFQMKEDLDMADILTRNLHVFKTDCVAEEVVDQYLRVLNAAEQRLGPQFEEVVKANEEVLKQTDLIYGVAGGKFLEQLGEDTSLRDVDDVNACLRIYKRILLPIVGRIPDKGDALNGRLAHDMRVTGYNEILMTPVKDQVTAFPEEQRVSVIIDAFNTLVSRWYKGLVDASQAQGKHALRTLHRVLTLNEDRANELGVHLSVLEKLVAEIPHPLVYRMYKEYLERQLEETTWKLEDSEKRYRDLIEKEKDLIYTLDARGAFIFASPALETILSYQQEEVLGQKFIDLVAQDWRAKALADFRTLLQNGEVTSETVLVDKAGAPHFIEYGSKTIKKDTEVIGAIGIARDITERIQIEKALQVHKEQLSVLLENSPDIILNIDEEGAIQYINRTAPGFTDENVIGTHASDYIKREYHTLFSQALDNVFHTGNPDQFESRFVDHTWWEIRLIPIKEKEQVKSAMVICTNITERKQLQEEILRSARLATIGQLASSIGHEIRNPLGVMKNSCYFLHMKLKDRADPKVIKHVQIIEREINSANLIVSELLDFARNRPPIVKEANLPRIIQSALTNVTIPREIHVITKFSDVPHIFVDPEQIRRVFLNLIQNAVQAMPDGGTLEIRISTVEEAIQITVKDTGVGIPPEHLPKLFTPLFSTKTKGVGLGLTICKQIVEGHAGKITVQSKENEGSRFTIILPCKRMVESD
jgi:PAS domain S-box-containing protein